MKKTIKWLTVCIAALAALASSGGLLIGGLYRDNAIFSTAWRANDIITLLLVPVLLGAYAYSRSGNHRAYLLWLGLLLYMFYNYAFYLFGAVFNWFFILYAALFILSLYALLFGLYHIDTGAIAGAVVGQRAARLAAIFLLLVALPLAVVEVGAYAGFVAFGKLPEIPILVMSLDLTLVVPNAVLAAVLLWRQHTWGFVLSVMMLVKSFTYGLVLTLGSLWIGVTGVGAWDPFIPFYAFTSVGGLIFLAILLKQLKKARSRSNITTAK